MARQKVVVSSLLPPCSSGEGVIVRGVMYVRSLHSYSMASHSAVSTVAWTFRLTLSHGLKITNELLISLNIERKVILHVDVIPVLWLE